jgi:hypothetical protein
MIEGNVEKKGRQSKEEMGARERSTEGDDEMMQ